MAAAMPPAACRRSTRPTTTFSRSPTSASSKRRRGRSAPASTSRSTSPTRMGTRPPPPLPWRTYSSMSSPKHLTKGRQPTLPPPCTIRQRHSNDEDSQSTALCPASGNEGGQTRHPPADLVQRRYQRADADRGDLHAPGLPPRVGQPQPGDAGSAVIDGGDRACDN